MPLLGLLAAVVLAHLSIQAGDEPDPAKKSAGIRAEVRGVLHFESGHGYYLVASDGGVFALPDAEFLGSMSGTHLDAPLVGIASTG